MTDEPAVTISHDHCVGVAMCVQQAPGAFALNGAGLSVFRPDGVWTREQLDDAAESCPTLAITVNLEPA